MSEPMEGSVDGGLRKQMWPLVNPNGRDQDGRAVTGMVKTKRRKRWTQLEDGTGSVENRLPGAHEVRRIAVVLMRRPHEPSRRL